MSRCFAGFTKETFRFLEELGRHNEKKWFEAHRDDYMEHVVRPMQNLVMDLSDTIVMIDPLMVTTPAVGKTISRINRDVRFSKDKSPYRNNVWITFKRPSADWMDCPCYYFEIYPDFYRYGMGYYSASKETMDKLRSIIDHRPSLFRDAISFFEEGRPYSLEGELYKRNLNPSLGDDLSTWYQRKNFYLACNCRADDRLFSGKLAEDVASDFILTKGFYDFLTGL
jgi:uncharacterized protein (TIGR02453 family)